MRDTETHELVRQRRVARLDRRWQKRTLLSLFIIWHLFAVAIWLMPPSVLVNTCNAIVRPYMTATGAMQAWLMFSPNPDTRDIYVSADITYADKTVQSWDFPRMVTLSYWNRYRLERYRKFVENANPDVNQALWPSLVRYAARVNAKNPKNPPVSVTLVRHFRFVPPPGAPMPPFQTYGFYTAAVTPEDLR